MSRANGVITFEDGFKMYCLYNGTCDVMFSSCYPKQQMAWDMYYKRSHARCDCIIPSLELVSISHDYGGGHTWTGLACRECLTLESNFEPFY